MVHHPRMEKDLPGETGYALRKYGPLPATKESEKEANKVDPDNPTGQAAASGNIEGASSSEASEVREELV